MKRPAIGLAIVFAARIWFGALVNWSPAWLASGAFLLLLAWWIQPGSTDNFLAVAWVMFHYRQSVTNSAPNWISNLLEHRDQNAALRGVIVSAPDFRDIRLYRADETGAATIRLSETGYEMRTYLGAFVLPGKKNGV